MNNCTLTCSILLAAAPLTALAQADFTKITTSSIVSDGGGSGACAWGDYDGDGWLDLFVTNLDGEKNFLYHNNGDGTFARITAGTVANDIQSWRGCAWADYDNDGNLDLIVAGVDDNSVQVVLYRNNGDRTFTRLPAKTLGGVVPAGQGAADGLAWADYDNDGFLDLFVARSGFDWLFHNDDNGVFRKITNSIVGTASEDSYSANWGDYNNDGRPDLFVAVSSDPPTNRLYLNRGGGVFEPATSGSIVTDNAHTISGAWADYDNDGYLDLFVANGGLSADETNALYHNNGDGTFIRMASELVGSLASDVSGSGGGNWGDYDNDGYLDLFVTNLAPASSDNNSGPVNFLYHNNGDGSFTRILTGGLANDVGISLGCVWGDYDNDGFLDLFVAKGGLVRHENNCLYRNNGNSNHWLKVKCVGTVSNRSAIGAKVRVKATIAGKTFWQLREIDTGPGWDGNPLEAHFGLGDAAKVDTLRIEWPSGIVQEFHGRSSKQFLTVTEPPRLLVSMSNGAPQFTLKGGRGFQYQIEASTNLTMWSPIGTLTITNLNGTVQIIDTNAPGSEQRYYRAVSR